LHLFATVGAPAPTGNALATKEVGLYSGAVTDTHAASRRPRPQRHHLDAKLVAQNARIAEEGLATAEGVEIGATDTHLAHPHQGFALARCGRLGSFRQPELAGLVEDNA
jgi:hypothetical protein